MRLRSWHSVVLAVALAGVAAPALGQSVQDSPFERLRAYRFGGDAAALDAVAAAVTEARQDPARRVQAARELAAILASDAAFDAKQFACRQLILIAGPEQVPVLVGLLSETHLAHYAIMVLARIPGDAVDAALLHALSSANGDVLLEVVDAVGERQMPAAIPSLTALLARAGATRVAAASALAKTMGPRTAPVAAARVHRALQQAFAAAAGPDRDALANVLLLYAERVSASGRSSAALETYSLLFRGPTSSMVHAAALRGVVQGGAPGSTALVLDALKGLPGPAQKMAAALAREVPGSAATQRFCAALPRLPARAQALLIAALGDRGDPSASAVVAAGCRNTDAAVRQAAMHAVARLGGAAAVQPVLEAIAHGGQPDREAGLECIGRMPGRGVDSALLAAVRSGDTAVAEAAIRAVGARRISAAVPELVEVVRSRKPVVSAAAVEVLKEMGRPEQLPVLLDLMLATPAGARDDVISAVTEIARRGMGEEERTGALLQRLATATQAADRADLLAALGEVGGPRALDALRKADADASSDVRLQALRLVSDWPTDEPMAYLLDRVKAAPDDKQRTMALRGYIRMIGLGDHSSNEAIALYKGSLELATDAAEKRLVLSGLARLGSLEALRCAAGFLTDNDLYREAEVAVVEISHSTLGTWPDRTVAALTPIANRSQNEQMKKQAQDIIAMAGKFSDFVVTWEVSPAYQQDGANYSQLFDIPFPPEQSAAVPWRAMPAGTSPDQPWLLDLLALWGGEQKVVYLRTNVWSETARELSLELGSDDGVKCWWNGQVVLSDNTARAVAPGQEKVKVQAKAGWNRMMVKITQNVMGWGACARFTNPDGTPVAGLKFSIDPDSVTK